LKSNAEQAVKPLLLSTLPAFKQHLSSDAVNTKSILESTDLSNQGQERRPERPSEFVEQDVAQRFKTHDL